MFPETGFYFELVFIHLNYRKQAKDEDFNNRR